jgi:hypothetical protein
MEESTIARNKECLAMEIRCPISDVLHDALTEIERHQQQQADRYADCDVLLNRLRVIMRAVQMVFDFSPGEPGDTHKMRLESAIDRLDVSEVETTMDDIVMECTAVKMQDGNL